MYGTQYTVKSVLKIQANIYEGAEYKLFIPAFLNL
jgi:hypothetical protein